MSYYNPTAFLPQPKPGADMFQGPALGGEDYYNNADEGRTGYTQWAWQTAGADRNGTYGDWLRNRYLKTRDEYGAAQGKQPDLKWTDYLLDNSDRITNEYTTMNPTQRAQQTGMRGINLPRARWM